MYCQRAITVTNHLRAANIKEERFTSAPRLRSFVRGWHDHFGAQGEAEHRGGSVGQRRVLTARLPGSRTRARFQNKPSPISLSSEATQGEPT